MRLKEKQPAKKSYFFGQGYTDIKTAITTLWQKNGEVAKKYYASYSDYGLLSFKGIFNLFCALSVVTFGSVFFLIISLLTLIVLFVFFGLVYIGFSLAWLFDRAYLIRRKVFVACNECKNKFLIPTYICPKCGAYHTNLTPSKYGILKRTCNCGEKLPTTFFNGRKELRAICPCCLSEGKTTYLEDRESRPFCIPIVGGRSVGKTAYITAFSREFLENVAPKNGLQIDFYNDKKRNIYAEIKSDYNSGGTRMTARPQDRMQSSSVSFSFFVKHRKLKPERLVHIYDIAGEVFTDNNENEVQRQYEYCQGIVLIIDPFSIPTVRMKYENTLTPQDIAGIGKADLNGVVNVFMNKLREVTGLSDRKMSKVPLAIVIGKADSGNFMEEFSEDKIQKIISANPNLSLTNIDAIDYLSRRFLIENEMGSFLNAVDLKFQKNRFFVASAIGHTRDAGQYNPKGVLEPMEWIAGISDKTFSNLWSTIRFNDKVIKQKISYGE